MSCRLHNYIMYMLIWFVCLFAVSECCYHVISSFIQWRGILWMWLSSLVYCLVGIFREVKFSCKDKSRFLISVLHLDFTQPHTFRALNICSSIFQNEKRTTRRYQLYGDRRCYWLYSYYRYCLTWSLQQVVLVVIWSSLLTVPGLSMPWTWIWLIS